MDSQHKRQFSAATKTKQPPKKTSVVTLWTRCHERQCTEELPRVAKVRVAIWSIMLQMVMFQMLAGQLSIDCRYKKVPVPKTHYMVGNGMQQVHRHSWMRMHHTTITTTTHKQQGLPHSASQPPNLTIPQSYLYNGTHTQPWPASLLHHCHTMFCVCTQTHTQTHTYIYTCIPPPLHSGRC